ncbi:MAG TPA: helix-turn-helix transcriptional regulator [Bryobacteraceae bacterium]|nr:helix-turn-helix transcriptional regulator [Bryobacteraceae bacterium]
MMEEPTTPPKSSSETLLEMVGRRMEEDQNSANAIFVSDLLKRPAEFRQTTLDYLTALFDISAYWNNFLVLDYRGVDLYYKPHLERLTEFIIAQCERLTVKWDAHERSSFMEDLKFQLVGKRSQWKAEALKRARRFNSQNQPSEEVPKTLAATGDSLAVTRQAYILPLLQQKGMSKSKWATVAGVDPSVVYDYLAGESDPRPDNRKALAETLGLKPSDLPE